MDTSRILCTRSKLPLYADSVEKQRAVRAESGALNAAQVPSFSDFVHLLWCGKDLGWFAEVLGGRCEEEFVICTAWAT